MAKILLLGGSAQQLVAIRAAKSLGYYTVLCDYLPDNPGQYEVDKYYPVSTTDVETVYQVARDEQVEGILAYASDPAALPAAVVSERLGLPTNPAQSVEILGIKYRWRQFLQEHHFACPQVCSFPAQTPITDIVRSAQHLAFPVVLKPTDSSGSKGITVLHSWQGLAEAIANANIYSRNKILLIEEYIERGFPAVIGGDIFVWDGKIVLYGEMECLRDDHSPLIPVGEKYPVLLTGKQRANIHDELQRVVSALDIRFGELNIEILFDKDDNVHFLELGPRAGGNMIPIQLSDAFGIDLVKANVQAAMGHKPDFIDATNGTPDGCYMHYVLHSYKEGRFCKLLIDAAVAPYVYRQVLYKKQGDKVEVFDGAGKAVGIIFLHFSTTEEMNFFCRNHNSLIKVVLS